MDANDRLLPLFPLPLVQFPGALTPLHIFEPRYRKMLQDANSSDRTFGIILHRQTKPASSPEFSVGSSVEVVDHVQLADGRSNIICRGVRRFRVKDYLEGEPYLRGRVEFFDDEPSTGDLSHEVSRVIEILRRVADLAQRLGERLDDSSALDSSGDAELLSLIVCSFLDLETERKQHLLEMVDTSARLEIAYRSLEVLAADYEKQLFAREVAGRNGHHGPVSMES